MRKILQLALFFMAHYSLSQLSPLHSISDHALGANNVIAFDVDQDGVKDVISTSLLDSKLAWYRQLQPGGSYDFQKVIDTVEVLDIVAVDIDGNGFRDIIYAAGDDRVYWRDNQGDITTAAVQEIYNASPFVYHANQLYIADVDSDLDLDIVIGLSSGGIKWLPNNGNGNFGPAQNITTWSGIDIVPMDVDIDGDLDFLFILNSTDLVFVENLGGGVFGSNVVLASFSSLTSIGKLDFDGDLDDDLYLCTNSGVERMVNNGGTLMLATIEGTTVDETGNPVAANTLKFGDVDNDGDQDVIVLHATNDIIGWFAHDGFGNLGTEIHIVSDSINVPSTNNITAINVEDMNDDGFVEILFTTSAYSLNPLQNYSKVGLIKNNGGLFENIHLLTSQTETLYDVMGADLDNDGFQDIVYTMLDGVNWYKNNGDSTFAAPQLIAHLDGKGGRDVDAVDLDQDGDLDLVCGTGQTAYDRIFYIENLGNGVFGSKIILGGFLPGVHALEYGDFDGDSDLDIAYSASYLGAEYLGWIENLGAGNFGPLTTITTGLEGTHTMRAADMDNDGIVDLVVGGFWGTARIAWFKCYGNGTFGTQQDIYLNPGWGVYFEVADFDSDGDMDIISSSELLNGTPLLHTNDGNGNFTNSSLSLTGRIIGLADVDVNGFQDILISDGYDVNWYQNNGSASFTLGSTVSTEMTEIVAIDLDNDGDQDIVTGSFPSEEIFISLNEHYASTQIHGTVFIDLNQNGVHDSLDVGLHNIPIISTPQSDFTFTYPDGNYFMNFSDTIGQYTVEIQVPNNWSVTTSPASYLVDVNPQFVSLNDVDFGIYPDTLIDSLDVQLIGGFPRCNSEVNYWLDYSNEGTTILSGWYSLELDPQISFVSSTVTPDSILGNTYYWSYDSLQYFQSEMLNMTVLMPDFNALGDTLISVAKFSVVDSLGNYTQIESDTLSQVIVCAYDPNDKTVDPAGLGAEGYVFNDQTLEYLIRFQNTGNDTALNVKIQDYLDPNLNWTSLKILGNSHPMQTSVDQSGLVTFLFEDIMLPDSNSNFLGSQGFIKYSIEMIPDLTHGQEIENTAHIYFDYNPAVVTNTTLNTIYECSDFALPISIIGDSILVAGNSNLNYQWIDCATNQKITGAVGYEFKPTVNGEYAVILFDGLCYDTTDCITVNAVGINDLDLNGLVKLYPNPATGIVHVEVSIVEVDQLKVYDVKGVLIEEIELENNWTEVVLPASGVYMIHIRTAGGVIVRQVVNL